MMRIKDGLNPIALSGASPNAAGNSIISTVRGLARFNVIRVDAILTQATGGTLDLYMQRRVLGSPPTSSIWLDWLHFTQLAAGTTVFRYSTMASDSINSVAISTVGQMNDDLSVGAFALAAGTFVGGLPGDELRLCAVAGASTSAGATQTVYLTGYELYT